MTPADLGLPPKFSKWRPGQDDAIIDAAVSLGNKRFYVSAQPTGAGKSPFYVGLSRLIEAKRTLILTATKALQTQLMADFASMGLVEIKGQNNYSCLAVARPGSLPGAGELHGMAPEKSSCDDGPCHAGVECSLRQKGCYYFDRVRTAFKSSIVVTNYDYWMYSNKFGERPIGEFDLLVLDEAHTAPDKLAEFVSIYIGRAELDDLLDQKLPPLDAGLEYWSEWAAKRLKEANAALDEMKRDKSGTSRRVRDMRNLASKLEDLANAATWKRGNPGDPNVWIPGAATDWVSEESDSGATFSPVWAHGYAEKFLFNGIPRVVLTSATIVPKTASYLGLGPDDFAYSEVKSSFPANRRPVYLTGNIRVGRNMSRGEEMVWMNKIDLILESRKDRKIIIHAVSYERARFIYDHSKHRNHMVVHSARDTAIQIDRFRRMAAPAILVSPSVREGYDFPFDQCEVQIVAKIPFVDMRPAVIQARRKQDKKYLDYLAIMALVQSCGRGMRAETDMCETFVVDANVGWLTQRGKEMIPRWFKTAMKRIDLIPRAPRRAPRMIVDSGITGDG